MSELLIFSRLENNEKNRKNAAFSFLKNIKLGNEPENSERNAVHYENPLKKENSYNSIKDNSEEQRRDTKPKFFLNDDGSDNESNSSNSKEQVNFNQGTITEIPSSYDLNKNMEFNKENELKNNFNNSFAYNEVSNMSEKSKRNLSIIIGKTKNGEMNSNYNFKTLWSARKSINDSPVFGRIHSLSDLTELSKQDKSNTLSVCGKSNSGDNMIRTRQMALNLTPMPIARDKRQKAAKKFLSNIQLVPSQTAKTKIPFMEKEIRKTNFNGYNREACINSNYLSIKGSQLKNYDNENKDDHEKELFNTVLNNIQVYTSPNGNIIGTFSVLNPKSYRENKTRIMSRNYSFINQKRNSKKDISFKLPNIQIRKKTSESYAKLLFPSHSLERKPPDNYHITVLDDPTLITGKHKTIIALPYFMSSIIQYSRPSDLKRELNEQFRQLHPDLDPSLTLTQIRKVKKDIYLAAQEMNLELSSVAKAYVYFERLILKNEVNKYNRKLIGATCLFLATKVNDPKEVSYANLLRILNKIMGVSPKEIRENEFNVFVALEFVLYVPLWDIRPHFERLVTSSEFPKVDMSEYIGDKMFYYN
jgi:hypothetical protein